ncbi:GlsB/YeaQ/YmgE family stress response membrane protein [Jeotgalibacillus proteolyticus]|uniref:GlsB/YeaQ/YmgE family stress response membrane protein n=1 Tax=Jeotgalibacillus proteolyticus TaxID=2082395 RepID=A0A2S5G8L2_9BACL|nr:GlsB/YeaQ/YmgE family stress response membrane protein [Jeotgalibacillus proteolyticus]PPA69318.1 GlsB/YeaQ/YmgE family stress response membrane protein [Jeotgalibacillus proteolyticus]
MGLLLYLIVGGLIGWLAGLLLGKDVPMGCIGNIIAGIIGSWIAGELLGGFSTFGPSVAGIHIIPALIGAVIFVFILSLILRAARKR